MYSWCWSTLKISFHSLILSKLDYAAPTWQLWLSATSFSCLDRPQNCAIRLVTGHLVSTTQEALLLQANIQSYHKCSHRLFLRVQVKALWSFNDHPKLIALAANVPQHLPNCCCFRRKVNDLSALFPAKLGHCQIINHFSSLPWQFSTLHKEHVSTFVLRVADQADNTTSKRQNSLTKLTISSTLID